MSDKKGTTMIMRGRREAGAVVDFAILRLRRNEQRLMKKCWSGGCRWNWKALKVGAKLAHMTNA